MPDQTNPQASQREHHYHAEATVLSGHLRLPLEQQIPPQAHAKIYGQSGYLSQHAEEYRLEGVISYGTAYTQVAGNREVKPGGGFNTLSTSVVENLNVMDVVTADRVVAQISTEHPLDGYVPTVTFLGTRFENLRIAGHPVEVDLDLDLLGEKPDGDLPYTKDSGFLERVSAQYDHIRESQDVPADILESYRRFPLVSQGEGPTKREWVDCSLVKQAAGDYSGKTFGHVIDIPNFGKIFLAVLCLEQSDYDEKTEIPKGTTITLTMIEFKLGCIANGMARTARGVVNGTSHP